ncbi:MBL fold metallo-hydrolase [Actinoplanes sp. RD1]|uniref:MBL fold metallo-hydrolase n=1 Tax=Actinoplanes sp. RD1 TaxID=3064538 RepID=UPI002741FCE3|nr:MBL fold metallo-hydrolase [Actinoplanes sp. RD1]
MSNTVVVRGSGNRVLLIDPGLQEHELTCLADDLAREGWTVAAGFSTHPDWDHLLWHARLGVAPRYGTARCAAAVENDPETKAAVIEHLDGTGIAEHMSLDLYGEITGLPAGTVHVPWDGPAVRIAEHRAHAPGHAALVIEDRGVLVAGDMLSDVLIPMLDAEAADPIGDYLAALDLLADQDGDVVVPGHGSAGHDTKERIDRDRAYLHHLRRGTAPDDPRIGPRAAPGWEWVSDVHAGQVRRIGQER